MFINPNWDQRLPPCLTAASVTLRHLSQSALLLWKIPLIQHTKPEPRLLFLSHLSSLTSAQPAAHPFQPYLHLCKTFWHSYPVRPPLADHVLSCSCSCLPACLALCIDFQVPTWFGFNLVSPPDSYQLITLYVPDTEPGPWARLLHHFFTFIFGVSLSSPLVGWSFHFHQIMLHTFVTNTSVIIRKYFQHCFPSLNQTCFLCVPLFWAVQL